jgi:hypothetical protein
MAYTEYASGVFTPTAVGQTTAGTQTYTKQVGQWTRIGNCVFIFIRVAWSANSGTGNINIGTLPFLVQSVSFYFPSLSVIPGLSLATTLPSGNTQCLVEANENSTVLVVNQYNPTTGSSGNLQVGATGDFSISGFYFTTA